MAIAATVASVQLYLQASQDVFTAPLGPLVAGRNQPIVLDEPESATPAAAPITISTTLDRTASIENYLCADGMDRESARQWASYFVSLTSNRYFRSGHPLTIYKDPDTGELRGFKYDLDYKTSVTEARIGAGLIKAAVEPIQYDERPVKLTFAITDSFRSAAADNGIPRPVVATLEEAFADRHDLNRLAPGSAIKLLYREKVSRDGNYHLVEGVEAAQIRFGSSTLKAFAFEDEEGRPHLYDEQGQALGAKHLRFPVKFKYISSGFTFHRWHPILHEYRPHVGVDLAAHYGEPVKAVADGKIQSAGWMGELGNCVRIEHSHGVVSIYGHLSKISAGVRPGVPVRVGQVIGAVGSTGLSSGPHLHFAIEKNGTYVNPLYAKIGENHPVSPAMQALFEDIKQRYEATLASLPDLSSNFVVDSGDRKPAISKVGAAQKSRHRRGLRVSSVRDDAAAPAIDGFSGAGGGL